MCTAISSTGERHLFGRTLDLECSYSENVVITPRAFDFSFIYEKRQSQGLAMIGTAHVANGVPLYYDAVNEAGLCAAGLNFPQFAVYRPYEEGKRNIASFELIPWVLSQCRSLNEAITLLEDTNVTSDSYSPELPSTPLHWLISDKSGSIAAEPMENGLNIYSDPFGVLTNSPPFPFHLSNLSNYMGLSPSAPSNTLFPSTELAYYSRGLGAFGLPGDFSSASRFVRATFANAHTHKGISKQEQISGFFHVMDTVAQPKGCALTETGRPIYTVYTSCADTESGEYYFTTYGCRQIRCVRLTDSAKRSDTVTAFPMQADENILQTDK